MRSVEVLIAGGGPAGMAAAVRAAECGKQVTMLDDNPVEGGQIWRGEKANVTNAQAAAWFRKLKSSGVEILNGTRIIDGNSEQRKVQVEAASESFTLEYETLIVATGARELFVPFPGWTLPNVLGAGGLQALVKSGLPVEGKRVVVAGSGPLLLAVAAYLRKRGAVVPLIAEQASWSRLMRFGVALARSPGKIWQALELRAALGSTSYVPGSWITSAEGVEKLASVRIRRGQRTEKIDCDYLAVAYGFWPNTELAQYLGCCMEEGYAKVDDFQRTSIVSIYCAGEVTGLGGVDLSLIEGEIAGYAAGGKNELARGLFHKRKSARRFAGALNQAFALRSELRNLADSETIVCRCEDVSLGRLQSADSWRAAKLHMRCGMGPCQGRICGPAVQHLLGWQPESVRAPVFPARVASLISNSITTEEGLPR